MKIRIGFVSNSSSSSFIVALRHTDDVCPHCGRKDLDFLDEIERSSNYNDDNRVHYRSKNDGIDVLTGYDWTDEDDIKEELIRNITTYHEQGYEIANFSISYHDEILRNEMSALKNTKKLVVLYHNEE